MTALRELVERKDQSPGPCPIVESDREDLRPVRYGTVAELSRHDPCAYCFPDEPAADDWVLILSGQGPDKHAHEPPAEFNPEAHCDRISYLRNNQLRCEIARAMGWSSAHYRDHTFDRDKRNQIITEVTDLSLDVIKKYGYGEGIRYFRREFNLEKGATSKFRRKGLKVLYFALCDEGATVSTGPSTATRGGAD